MRRFNYFLFENFDSDVYAQNPLNPRRMLGRQTDNLLSYIVSFQAGKCPYAGCLESFGQDMVNTLIAEEILRKSGDKVLFNVPIFMKEDASALKLGTQWTAAVLADKMAEGIEPIFSACREIDNGFSVERNLYHILCGMIFDGLFFDYLERKQAVEVSRMHKSGLDYLSVIYEQCDELDDLSNGLLCSYNRFTDGECSLESFGDADGDRHDFYRFFRLLESGPLPERFATAQKLLNDFGEVNKTSLLEQVKRLYSEGNCDPEAMALLTHFGYAMNGTICVPLYSAMDTQVIGKIAEMAEILLGDTLISGLTELTYQLDITAVHHGVAPREIANELYHILFGTINEELAARGIVEKPCHIPGEGRYLRCIRI